MRVNEEVRMKKEEVMPARHSDPVKSNNSPSPQPSPAGSTRVWRGADATQDARVVRPTTNKVSSDELQREDADKLKLELQHEDTDKLKLELQHEDADKLKLELQQDEAQPATPPKPAVELNAYEKARMEGKTHLEAMYAMFIPVKDRPPVREPIPCEPPMKYYAMSRVPEPQRPPPGFNSLG